MKTIVKMQATRVEWILKFPSGEHDGKFLCLESKLLDEQNHPFPNIAQWPKIVAIDPGSHVGWAVLAKESDTSEWVHLVAAGYVYLGDEDKPFSEAIEFVEAVHQGYGANAFVIEQGFHSAAAMNSNGTKIEGAIRAAFEWADLPVGLIPNTTAFSAIGVGGYRNDAAIASAMERIFCLPGRAEWGVGKRMKALPTHLFDAVLSAYAAAAYWPQSKWAPGNNEIRKP